MNPGTTTVEQDVNDLTKAHVSVSGFEDGIGDENVDHLQLNYKKPGQGN